MISIGNGLVSAVINPRGAELTSLRDASREYIWQAGPAWPKHSPVLFPIVGQVNNDTYRVNGQEYHLGRHGFARDSAFAAKLVAPDHAQFELTDNAATRAVYPFAFRLTLDYQLAGAGLRVSYRVENTGIGPLPFSLGAHPAFAWPSPKQVHSLIFDQSEPAPVRRLQGGLLAPQLFPTPIQGHELPLSDALFVDDALILDDVASHGVHFGSLRVHWCDEMPFLGVWTKPGADFLCIEPWAGHSDPVGFSGEIWEKPGINVAAPGEVAQFWWEVVISQAA